MKGAKVNQSQLDALEYSLKFADLWLDSQKPSDQLRFDKEDVEEAYAIIQQLRFDLNGR